MPLDPEVLAHQLEMIALGDISPLQANERLRIWEASWLVKAQGQIIKDMGRGNQYSDLKQAPPRDP